MQEAGETGKDNTVPKPDQLLAKAVNRCDIQEAQHMLTSSIIERPIKDSYDCSMASDETKSQGSIGSTVLGQGDSKHSSQKRKEKTQCSLVFTKQEESQHRSQCKIVSIAESKSSQQYKEKKSSVINSQQEGHAGNEVKILVPHEVVMMSSSVSTCASNHQEVRQELQRTSVKKVELQQDGGKKTLSRELVDEGSCSGVYLSSRSGKPCRSDHVAPISAQKSVVHGTVNVRQTSNITNLLQAQSVASFSAPEGNQPQKSLLKSAQVKKGSKRD